MSDDTAKQLTHTIAKVVHGVSLFDAERALCAVMSCGMCVKAETEEEVFEMLDLVFNMLSHQVKDDFPKIKAMQAEGRVNDMILPTQKM